MFKKLLGKILQDVIVPVAKEAAKRAAEEAVAGVIEKRIGADGRIISDMIAKAGKGGR